MPRGYHRGVASRPSVPNQCLQGFYEFLSVPTSVPKRNEASQNGRGDNEIAGQWTGLGSAVGYWILDSGCLKQGAGSFAGGRIGRERLRVATLCQSPQIPINPESGCVSSMNPLEALPPILPVNGRLEPKVLRQAIDYSTDARCDNAFPEVDDQTKLQSGSLAELRSIAKNKRGAPGGVFSLTCLLTFFPFLVCA